MTFRERDYSHTAYYDESMLQCVVVRCNVLRYAAMCCSVLQCVATLSISREFVATPLVLLNGFS